MTISKLAPFAAALVLLSVATHAAQAAPANQGEFISGDYGSAFDSNYRNPNSREALDSGTW
jgi:hypothetical protein